MMSESRRTRAADCRIHLEPMQDDATTSRWLGLAICLSLIILVLQLFPSVFWSVMGILDVRNWHWWSFSVLFAVAIIILVLIRSRQAE
jgi:hypothetical protein